MAVSLYFGGKSHVSNGCKMYLVRSPAEFRSLLPLRCQEFPWLFLHQSFRFVFPPAKKGDASLQVLHLRMRVLDKKELMSSDGFRLQGETYANYQASGPIGFVFLGGYPFLAGFTEKPKGTPRPVLDKSPWIPLKTDTPKWALWLALWLLCAF